MNSNTPFIQKEATPNSTPFSNVVSVDDLYTPQGFSDLTYIQDPLARLAENKYAVVHIEYPCNLCYSCCEFTYNYDTFLNTKMGLQYLFKNVSKINCSFCIVNDIINRFEKCISYNMSSYEQFNSNTGTAFAELVKNKNKDYTCVGCCEILLDINILP